MTNILGVFNRFCASDSKNPRPFFAACISANTTPVVAVAAARRRPLNILGRAAGIMLRVRGLFVSGILISSLGAVMDVSMSIASSVTELSEVNPGMSSRSLFRSGMNIGRDMIGTMTNTLILAFAGTSLNLMIIMFAAGMQPYQLLNNNDTIMEVIRAIAGSIGLVLAVPLTAAVASARFKKTKA